MADFAGGVVEAAEQMAVDDGGGADAGAGDDVRDAALAAAGAVVELAQAGGFGVVINANRDAELLRDHALKRRVVEAGEVGGIEQGTGLVVDRAGTAEAQRGDVLTGWQMPGEPGDFFGDAVNDTLRAECGVGGNADARGDRILPG